MPKEQELFGKTFDQLVVATKGKLSDKDVRPNRMILGEVILEPVSKGIRVTARDVEHKLLWGFIASKDMLSQVHCPVAVYDSLHALIAEELKRHALPSEDAADPVASAQKALDGLQQTVSKLRESLTVKKISPATVERARTVKRVVNDANQLLQLESL